MNGVLVHTGTEGNGNSGYLIDMTPATSVYYWVYDPAVMVGQSFVDPDTGVTMTTDWVTGTGASVTVSFGSGTTGSDSDNRSHKLHAQPNRSPSRPPSFWWRARRQCCGKLHG